MSGVLVDALICDMETGEQRKYQIPGAEDDLLNLEYMWAEGNYSCDCNRHLFFCRAGGEPDADPNCGESRFFVTPIERGTDRVIYQDDIDAPEGYRR